MLSFTSKQIEASLRLKLPTTSNFTLARIKLSTAGCPEIMASTATNKELNKPIVVVKNLHKIGLIESTGYYPEAVVMAGNQRRMYLMRQGFNHAYAWVEAGAIKIQADDAIGCNELTQKLGALLRRRYPISNPDTGLFGPYIKEVYPFENYFIYDLGGETYRQTYTLNPVAREVELTGPATAVNEKFVNAGQMRQISAYNKESLIPVNTGMIYYPGYTKGNNQSISPGATNCELLLMLSQSWANVQEAAQMYVDATKFGLYKPMTPAFQPVPLTVDNKIIASVLNSNSINLFDFACWTCQSKKDDPNTKMVHGKPVPKSKFAVVVDPKDKSTWKDPVDTPGRARNALSRINQTQGVPPEKKKAALAKIRKVAKQKGVDVSDKPTSGQKKWAHVKAKTGYETVTQHLNKLL